jgi:cyclopropane fatty-acyl-phospholipid synthase-like methyltransferase
MNFGYRHSDPAIELLPLLPEDEPDRSAIQLYHHVLGGVDLNGRDVLEMGCGRGGGCWYISRYCAPRSVTGLDLSQNDRASPFAVLARKKGVNLSHRFRT